MGYSSREVRKTLVLKLKAKEDRSRKHLRYKVFDDNGTFVAATHISHGVSDINDDLLTLMARQLGIRTSELRAIIICELNRLDYLKLATG